MELGGDDEIYATYKAPQAPITMKRKSDTNNAKPAGRRKQWSAGASNDSRSRGSMNGDESSAVHSGPREDVVVEKYDHAPAEKSFNVDGDQQHQHQQQHHQQQPVRKSLAALSKGIAATAKLVKLSKEDNMRKESFEELVGIAELEKLVNCFIIKRPASPLAALVDGNGGGGGAAAATASPSLYLLEEQHRPTTATKVDEIYRGLSEDEFVEEVHKILDSQSKDEIRQWFRRIDADGTNCVGWEEFSTFLLSHGQQKNEADFRASEYAKSCLPRSCPAYNQHEEHITVMLVHPKSGRLYTGSRDGALRVWSGDTLKHQKLFYHGSSWVTGMRLTKGDTKLLVCTLERSFHIFDAKTCEMLRTYVGREIIEHENGLTYAVDSIPLVSVGRTAEGYMAAKNVRVHARGAGTQQAGATGSSATKTLNFDEYRALMEEERVKRSEKKKLEQFTLADMLDVPTCMEYFTQDGDEVVVFGMRKGHLRFYKIPTTQIRIVRKLHTIAVHTDAVNSMRIVDHLASILTCSDDGTIKLTNLQSMQVTKTFRSQILRTEIGADISEQPLVVGIHAIEVSSVAKIFVSCGHDRQPLVWDHLQENPVFHLEEHPAPLLGCTINEADGHIITASIDNCIKIFDWRSYRCVQVIHERLRARENVFSTLLFDKLQQRIVCGSTWPAMYSLRRKTAEFPPHYNGHTTPVVGMLFNPVNENLVTFDNEYVNVWKPGTGKLTFQFGLAAFSGVSGEYRLTAISFDGLHRRVITGFHQGTVVIWNPSNGQPLNIIRDPDSNGEVNAVISIQRKGQGFYIASVGSRILIAREAQQFTITNVVRWPVPTDLGNVLCIEPVSEHLFVCGTDTGAVFFFHLLDENIDGKVLWLSQQDRSARTAAGMLSPTTAALLAVESTSLDGDATIRSMSSSAGEAQESQGTQLQHHPLQHSALKVERVFLLKAQGLVMANHGDGRVAFWHIARRQYGGQIALAHRTNSIVSNVAVDEVRNDYLAHSDEVGNLHVWKLVATEQLDDDPFGNTLSSNTAAAATLSARPIISLTSSHIYAQFHAHHKAITCITFVRLVTPCIVVGAGDGHVKMFTVEGACIGQVGLGTWSLSDSVTWVYNKPAPIVAMGGESRATLDNEELISETLRGRKKKSEELLLRRLSNVAAGSDDDNSPRQPLPPVVSAFAASPNSDLSHSPAQLSPRYAPKRPTTRGVVVSPASPGGRVGYRRLEGLVRPNTQQSSMLVPPALKLTAAEMGFSGMIAKLTEASRSSSSVSSASSTRSVSPQTEAPVVLLETAAFEPPVERRRSRKVVSLVVPNGDDKAMRDAIMKQHLESQERRLRENRDSLMTDDMSRAVGRLHAINRANKQTLSAASALPALAPTRSRSTSTSVAFVVSSEAQQLLGGLDNWTERVATLIHTHELDEIAPPKGSRAYEEEQRRGFKRHNVFSKQTKKGASPPRTARF